MALDLTGREESRSERLTFGSYPDEAKLQELDAGDARPVTEAPLPDFLERGELRSYNGGRIVLGPLPTDEEWLDIILRQGVEEVVTTLDPASPEDAERLEEELTALEGSGVTVTERPLDPASPDPQEVQSIAGYAPAQDGTSTYTTSATTPAPRPWTPPSRSGWASPAPAAERQNER